MLGRVSNPSGVSILLIGAALVFLPAALLLVPLLYIKRLVVHLKVTESGGQPVAFLQIRGVRNRAHTATSPTGDGHLTDQQLDATTDSLGRTDATGRFQRTYYLRNFHTLWVGKREVFVDSVRANMTSERAASIIVNGS